MKGWINHANLTAGISRRAAKEKAHRFGNLYGLLDENFLEWCFWQLKRDAAPGVDQVDFYEYRENLDENIANLVKCLIQKNYRAKLVRRQYIPKIRREPGGFAAHAVTGCSVPSAPVLWFPADDGLVAGAGVPHQPETDSTPDVFGGHQQVQKLCLMVLET